MPHQQWKYARLLREEQVRQDPAGEERAEESWHLPAESEYIPLQLYSNKLLEKEPNLKNGMGLASKMKGVFK